MNNVPDTIIEERKIGEKSVLQKLNELAQYNEVGYYFKLEKDEVRL